MEQLIRVVVLLSAVFVVMPASSETSDPVQSGPVAEPANIADYIAELERMGGECQEKLNTGTGADRMWRVCADRCLRNAQELRDWQGDPERALIHAQRSMVKCGNNYNAGIDYEKRVKR